MDVFYINVIADADGKPIVHVEATQPSGIAILGAWAERLRLLGAQHKLRTAYRPDSPGLGSTILQIPIQTAPATDVEIHDQNSETTSQPERTDADEPPHA